MSSVGSESRITRSASEPLEARRDLHATGVGNPSGVAGPSVTGLRSSSGGATACPPHSGRRIMTLGVPNSHGLHPHRQRDRDARG